LEEKINGEMQIKLYPNPTTGELRITIDDCRFTIDDIKIYDIVGKLQQSKIVNSHFEGGRGMSEIVIDISTLSSGIYFITVTDENQYKIVKKIVKE
jgi:hypothetical protein